MRLHLWPHLPPLRHYCEGCCNFRVVSTFSHSVAIARCCERRASLAQRLARELIRSRRARLAAPFMVFAARAARCAPVWWAEARSLCCCSSVAIRSSRKRPASSRLPPRAPLSPISPVPKAGRTAVSISMILEKCPSCFSNATIRFVHKSLSKECDYETGNFHLRFDDFVFRFA